MVRVSAMVVLTSIAFLAFAMVRLSVETTVVTIE